MGVKFCVLGSGSDGNAALVMARKLHVLIDAGFGPDELALRMDGTGASWQSVAAVVLTHLHADHLKLKCLVHCAKLGIPLHCHARHAQQLESRRFFKQLKQKELVRIYEEASPFEIARGGNALRFHPLPLPHDAPPTFGFKIEARIENGEGSVLSEESADRAAEAPATPAQRWIKLGYLVDLGECADPLVKAVADVDLLALEFNHDVKMERTSGRHPRLIQRVLGPEGHLSNDQAAEVFRRVLEICPNGGPKLLVQMHLSRDCNRADLAYEAAQRVLLVTGAQTRVYSTRQHQRGSVHTIE